MSNKIGESNVVTRFQEHFSRKMSKMNGIEAPYSFGNFQGMADEHFADCFISTEARCTLIEFKELESEVSAEKRKPLRDDLCSLLQLAAHYDNEQRAAAGHFIVWYDPTGSNENIHSYPRRVCPLFGIEHEFSGSSYTEVTFIKGLIEGRIGLKIDELNEYVQLLSQIAQQSEGESCPEFKAFLFTYDNSQDDFKSTPFGDLCQLQELMKLAMKNLSDTPAGPKPRMF